MDWSTPSPRSLTVFLPRPLGPPTRAETILRRHTEVCSDTRRDPGSKVETVTSSVRDESLLFSTLEFSKNFDTKKENIPSSSSSSRIITYGWYVGNDDSPERSPLPGDQECSWGPSSKSIVRVKCLLP